MPDSTRSRRLNLLALLEEMFAPEMSSHALAELTFAVADELEWELSEPSARKRVNRMLRPTSNPKGRRHFPLDALPDAFRIGVEQTERGEELARAFIGLLRDAVDDGLEAKRLRELRERERRPAIAKVPAERVRQRRAG